MQILKLLKHFLGGEVVFVMNFKRFIPAISPLLIHLKKENQIHNVLSKPFHGIILR
jgi:hypothetical protein